MPLFIPIVAKVLAGLASSEIGSAAPAQKADTDKAGNASNFTQTVDDVSRNAAAAAQQSTQLTGRG